MIRFLCLVCVLLCIGDVNSEVMRPRYTLVDMGSWDFIGTPGPRIDSDGNLTKWPDRVKGDYELKYTQPGGLITGYSLTYGTDPTNLLPQDLAVNYVLDLGSRDPESRHFAGTHHYLAGLNSQGLVFGQDTIERKWNGYFVFDYRTGDRTYVKSHPDLFAISGNAPILIDINASGQLVGRQDDYAVIWDSPTADPILLSTLVENVTGWMLRSASGINDLGEIVGYAEVRNGDRPEDRDYRAYKLVPIPSPVPEPSTIAIFALGAFTLWVRSIRTAKRYGPVR